MLIIGTPTNTVCIIILLTVKYIFLMIYATSSIYKAIRKLTASRNNVENILERREITKEYVNPDSQTYAPLTRVGVFLDRNSENYNVKSRYLSTYDGLLELENFLPDFVVQPRIKAPKPKTVTKAGFVKRKYRQERELAEIHEVGFNMNCGIYSLKRCQPKLEGVGI